MRFGEKLRKARKEKGLTQAQLAKEAELSTRTIIYYEQGQTYPQNRGIYKRLASILDVDADYLHNENDDFLARAMAEGGTRGRRQAEQLLEDINGLFSGGDMADEDMDEFMRAVQDAFWNAKDKNRKKYGKKESKEM